MTIHVKHTGDPGMDALMTARDKSGRGEADASLDALAAHCLAARTIIGDRGSPVMRRLVDLLLFEVGAALADRPERGTDREPVPRGTLPDRRRRDLRRRG